MNKHLLLFLVCLPLFCGCQKDPMTGKATLNFEFRFEGKQIAYHTGIYTLASGEKITIDNLQFFVSDVYLIREDGSREAFEETKRNVHYVDSDPSLASTLKWTTKKEIPTGIYEYVEFVYGLDSLRNRSGLFVNAPQKDMFWPEALGGGYHYMKLNGHWTAAGDTAVPMRPFGFHTGIGQSYGSAPSPDGSFPVLAFHQNYARLRDTLRVFMTEDNDKQLTLTMEVSEWFRGPNVWKFEQYGGSIMQNQQAQAVIKENAKTVFKIRQ